MHEKVLPQHSLELLTELEADASPLLTKWTLAGGTGLAFHLGHRLSDDLDFFRTDGLDVRALHNVLAAHGRYETLQEADHTLTVYSAHQTGATSAQLDGATFVAWGIRREGEGAEREERVLALPLDTHSRVG